MNRRGGNPHEMRPNKLQKKNVGHQLPGSDDTFRGFIENLPVMFYAVEPQPPFAPIYISPAFEAFGYPLSMWFENVDMWVRTIHPEDRRRVLAKTEAAMKSGSETDFEYRMLKQNGEVRWVRDRGRFIRDRKGQAIYWQGIILDITERRQAEEALKETETRYRSLFENLNDLIYVHDLKGNYLSINYAAERVFGYTNEEARQLNIKQVIAPEYWPLAKRMLENKIAGAKQTSYEVDCLTKDKRRVTLEINSSAIYRDGVAVAIQGIARDVTERKRAEEALQNSEAELRALFAAMTDIIIVLDQSGRYLKVAPSNSKLLYKSADEMVGKKLEEVFPKAQADFFMQAIRRALRKKESIRIEYCLPIDEKDTWFSAVVSPMHEDTVLFVARDITERKQYEEALKNSEEQYRELFENANDLIYTFDLQGNFTSLNRTGEIITGYTRDEILRMNFVDIVAPEYVEEVRDRIRRKISGELLSTYELEIIAKDGQRVSLETSNSLIIQNKQIIGLQGIGRDITARKRAEAALIASEQRYRLLGDGILHQVWTAMPDGQLDYVNSRTLEYIGCTLEEMLGGGWQNFVHPDDLGECLKRWKTSLKSGQYFEMECRLRRADGTYRWHLARATAGFDESGRIIKWFGTNTDIDEKKAAVAKLDYYARHDALTDLPNRAEFMKQLKEAIERSTGNAQARFAVLFLDLDRFKVINDSLGHVIGDKLLVAIAERLKSGVRPGDVVARLGGDEFTILLNRTGSVDDVARVAERLQRKLSKPFKLDNYEVFTSASIGIIVSDEIMRQPEDFLRDADTAMYRAKEAGKARYEIFDREMHVRNMNLLKVETDLRHAVDRGEFEVFYQPIVSLETGATCEFEALIRWRHPEFGLIQPNEFISVAEETGLIIPIGEWILREACRQTAEWQQRYPAFKDICISVNLSAKQLMHPSLTRQVSEILRETSLSPRYLNLEVTESTVMEHSDTALGVLEELHRLGITLSTDDFGTGYSSLSYLHRFSFERLKIDRSFTGRMDTDEKSAAIVRTIMMLGNNLNIDVVAEGIENEKQLERLMLLGCLTGQGYLFSPPVEAAAAEKLLLEGGNFYGGDSPLLGCAKANEKIIEISEIC